MKEEKIGNDDSLSHLPLLFIALIHKIQPSSHLVYHFESSRADPTNQRLDLFPEDVVHATCDGQTRCRLLMLEPGRDPPILIVYISQRNINVGRIPVIIHDPHPIIAIIPRMIPPLLSHS